MTIPNSKQLLPIYDKPLIYYPLSTLMLANIQEICVISTKEDIGKFQNLLGDGSKYGIELTYKIQLNPEGIAQAFLIAEDFIDGDEVALILGDNLFQGQELESSLEDGLQGNGARIFIYQVSNPSDYGVLEIDSNGKALRVEEKPKNPNSNWAITGLYLFDGKVSEIAQNVKPSMRGELEITSIMEIYLDKSELDATKLNRGTAWLDTGTPNSMHDASSYVRVIEERTGKKIGCIEEIAFNKGWIDSDHLTAIVESLGKSAYGKYLGGILEESKK
jgi:glucose-1-phosphate thymidylyltransferase